ncbi:MAG: class I SAM-dependent methyltransferase [Rhodospirillaceae bacterium]
MSTPPVIGKATWRDDARVLLQFLHGRRSGADHGANLDAFYGPQADVYDRFRERLLHGRADLMQAMDFRAGQRVIDFGAGTGRHWLFVEPKLPQLARVDLVDLCTPLLDVARTRFAGHPNVCTVRADAQVWTADEPADAAIFSYSLSMIPDWRAALANAVGQLRPGGLIGIVDFYTLPDPPPGPFKPLSKWNRAFWPHWFSHDGVMLRPQVPAALLEVGATVRLEQGLARLPYLPLVRAPWFFWIGRRPA